MSPIAKLMIATVLACVARIVNMQATAAQSFDLDEAAQAVVRIRACDASGCDRGVGSGVIIEPSGIILTANHVTLSNPDDPLSDPLNDFVIEMTTDWRAVPAARYRASLAASDRTDDLALLQIYWDEVAQENVDVADLALPALPLAGRDDAALGQRLHFLGYPLLGGATINYLDLGLSGFDGLDDTLLKVTGTLSPGYSGGPALVEQGDGFRVLGAVIRRRFVWGSELTSGQVSLIRSVDALPGFDWKPAARRIWVDDVEVAAVPSSDATFAIDLDLRALDFADGHGRAMAYAYDAASGLPWRPQGSDLPSTAAGQVVLSAEFAGSGFL